MVIGVGVFFRSHFAEIPKWQARQAIRDRDADKALAWLANAESLTRRDPEIEFLKARAYRRQGELDKTRSSLVRALELGFPVERVEREQWLALAQAGQLKEAEPHLAKLLMDPQGDEAEICEAYVTGYIRSHRIDDAFPLVRSWAADSPDDPLPPLTEGKLWIELGNTKEAERPLMHALDLNPECHEAAYYLANVYLDDLRTKEALELYQRCAANMSDPQDRDRARIGQAHCHRALADPEQGRKILAEMLKENPANRDALIELGRTESDLGRYPEALAALEKGDARNHHDIEVRYAWAGALRSAGRIEEARKEFEKIGGAQAALARTPNLMDRIRENPGDVEARYEAGEVFLKYGDPEKGITWLQSVLDYEPGHGPAKTLLAEYYARRAKENPKFGALAKRYGGVAKTPSGDSTE